MIGWILLALVGAALVAALFIGGLAAMAYGLTLVATRPPKRQLRRSRQLAPFLQPIAA